MLFPLQAKYSWWISLLLTFIIICFAAFFCTPIYNSKEDVYVLYLLAGGFGNPPTELLHYNHLMHPAIGLLLRFLFVKVGILNWYTVSLYAALGISIHTILDLILRRIEGRLSILFIAVVILVFGKFFLLNPTYSAASIMLAIAGLLIFFDSVQCKQITKRSFIYSLLLITFGFLFRLHTIAPVLLLAIPFFIIYWKDNVRMYIKYTVAVLVLGLTILVTQRIYYTYKIPGWEKEEAYRQKLFPFYNQAARLQEPLVSDSFYIQYNLVKKGLAWDKSFLSGDVLDNMLVTLKKKNAQGYFTDKEDIKWFFVNHKLEFITIIFLFMALYVSFVRIRLLPGLVVLIFLLGGFVLYGKTPPYAVYGLLVEYFTFAVILIKEPVDKRKCMLLMSFSIFLIVWAFRLMIKEGRMHQKEHTVFVAAFNEVKAHPDSLFLSMGDFPLASFYVWDVPASYKLINYLDSEHFILNIANQVFQRYQLLPIQSSNFPYKLLLWGADVKGVSEYFSEKINIPCKTSDPLHTFKMGIVRSLEK